MANLAEKRSIPMHLLWIGLPLDFTSFSTDFSCYGRQLYLTHRLYVYIQSLTTASWSKLFGSVVEHWIIDLVGQAFFQPNCYALFFVTLSCRKMGAPPGLDLILHQSGLILCQNGFQIIINDVFLEEGECYGR